MAAAVPELVIFDCDGTLVDSEALNNKAFTGLLHEYGLHQYDYDYALEHFVGITLSKIMLMIQMETGFQFPEDTVARYIKRVEELQAIELNPIAGALDLVRTVGGAMKICVGSNGERSNVLRAIQLTGLGPFFPEAHVFTKIQVVNAKPAPDLFLFAATRMGVVPEACMVIEDSEAGVTAGVAAGMQVIGFTGSNHEREKHARRLKSAGAHHIAEDLIHIPALLGI